MNLDLLGEAMGRDPQLLSDWLNGRHYPFRKNRDKVERLLDEVMSGMQCLKDFGCQTCPTVTKAAFNGLQERNRHPLSKKLRQNRMWLLNLSLIVSLENHNALGWITMLRFFTLMVLVFLVLLASLPATAQEPKRVLFLYSQD